MPNIVNRLLLKEYKERYDSTASLIAIGYDGLDVERTNRLRGALEAQEIRLDLVKNRIARIAFRDMGLPDIDPILLGQTALATGGEDPVAMARFFVDFRKENKEVKIHGALVEETILDEEAVVSLSKSPTKEELKGIIAGQALSPGGTLSGALLGAGGMLAGQIKTMIETMEENGEAA